MLLQVFEIKKAEPAILFSFHCSVNAQRKSFHFCEMDFNILSTRQIKTNWVIIPVAKWQTLLDTTEKSSAPRMQPTSHRMTKRCWIISDKPQRSCVIVFTATPYAEGRAYAIC